MAPSSAQEPFVPVALDPAAPVAGLWGIARATRMNALTMWPTDAYRQETFIQSELRRPRFLLNGEAGIHRVLVANPRNYRRTPATLRVLRPIAGDGLLLSEGEAWRRQRQIVGPALAPRVMPILARHVVAGAERALARLQPGTVDVLGLMQLLTLDIASRSMFSVPMDEHGPSLRDMMTSYGLKLGRPTLLDLLLPTGIPTPRDLSRTMFRWRWVRLMDRIMRARPASPPDSPPRDLFDLLQQSRDPETGTGFSRPQLRDQMATMILAGHETTALTLFWALYLLANTPGLQARLAEEVRGFDPDAAAEAQVLKTLPFTRAVIQESLRLYPPAFTLVRKAIGEDRFGDTTVPPGAIVLIAPWVLHRHEALWDRPAAFDPSRFEGDPVLAHRFAYLPFGAGPRVCVGAQFALTEAVIVLAMLVQRFTIELEDKAPVLPVAIITTQPDRPVPFRFRLRS
ncbi:MAG: cytochrome P450 [Acetobacteraceae bacterium]|nr:cytochrome P450 [Acetobacteraceae bacterium]